MKLVSGSILSKQLLLTGLVVALSACHSAGNEKTAADGVGEDTGEDANWDTGGDGVVDMLTPDDHPLDLADLRVPDEAEDQQDLAERPDLDVVELPDSVDADSDTAGDIEVETDQCPLGQDLTSWVKWLGDSQGTQLEASCGEWSLAITVLDNSILRVRYQEAAGTPDYSYAVVGGANSNRTVTFGGVAGSNSDFRICTPALRFDLNQTTCAATLWDSQGHKLWSVGNLAKSTVASGADGATVAQYSLLADSPAQERFYGFGEKTGPLNKRGRSMSFWNSDNPAYGPNDDPLYQSIPFFVGLREGLAYGVFVDNSAYMTLDMASQAGATTYAVKTERVPPDFYLIGGPEVSEVVQRYVHLTGTPNLPPRWTLGYHQCRWSYYPDTRVKEICDQLRTRQIPADGIWLDIDYMDGFRSFTWSPAGFPDPTKLVSDVEEIGFKVTAIIDPGLKRDPGWIIYDTGSAQGAFLKDSSGNEYVGEVWPGDAVFPDFTNPTVRDWWGMLVPNLTGHGVRGIWLDMNEPASFKSEYGWTVPNTLQCNGDGHATTMAFIHNVYALLESKATYSAMKAAVPGRRPFLLTRAGHAGIQRYAAVWTGDAASNWPALRMQLATMMNMGLSGVPMTGSDVGGWEGGTTPELFARWVEVGAISPFFRAHVQSSAANQEPWEFGTEVEDISRIHISERYRLLPYWYSLLHRSAVTGEPIIRPLVYEFQQQSQVWDVDDETMVGPWLLVAPALEQGQTQRTVVLPEGEWLEYYSGAHFTGPATINHAITLQAMPMYLREGAIVPKGPLMQYSDAAPVNPLQFDLFPGPDASQFVLYEDDGETPVESSAPGRVEYSLQRTATGARFEAGARTGNWMPPARRVLLRFRAVDHAPTLVTLDGTSLGSVATYEELLTSGPALYFFDANDRSLWVGLGADSSFVVEATYDPTLSSESPDVLVTLRVTVPQGTATTTAIHVATSANAWAQTPLEWVDSTTAQGTVSVPRGEWFYYKYTRGDWNTVEKWPACQEANNRYAFGKAWPVKEDEVYLWADYCE